jgi:hypothetical protein
MSKHDAMKEFFQEKVESVARQTIGFNFVPDRPDTISFLTSYSDKVRKNYMRVGAEKEYGFQISIAKSFSEETDDLNLEAMNFAQAMMDWIEEQNEKKKYPDFGPGCRILKLECLQNMPNLAEADVDAGIAYYVVQCRVIYFEKKKRRVLR